LKRKDLSYIEINPELQVILNHVEAGDNIVVNGQAGSGKSSLIDIIAHDPKYETKGTTLYAGSTGISAINITEKVDKKASTLHRAMGFGIEKIYPEDRVVRGKYRKFFKEDVSRIIIDEISMVTVDLMNKFLWSLLGYYNVKVISPETLKVLDGIQLILLGDVLQLEGVVKKNEKEEMLRMFKSPTHFFFGSELYQALNFVELPLLKSYRTDHVGFLNAMRKIRIGNVTAENMAELSNHFLIGSEEEYIQKVLPTPTTPYTTICTTNKEVDKINEKWLNKIDEPEITITSVIYGDIKGSDKVVPDELILKKG